MDSLTAFELDSMMALRYELGDKEERMQLVSAINRKTHQVVQALAGKKPPPQDPKPARLVVDESDDDDHTEYLEDILASPKRGSVTVKDDVS